MVSEITIDIIQETGYKSWKEFLMSIHSITSLYESKIYQYYNSEGNRAEIKLDLNSTILERLALEEGRVILPLIKMSSFSELSEKIFSENGGGHSDYKADVIIRNTNATISLRRISLKMSHIERLAAIEKKDSTYHVFHEEINKIKQ